MIFKCVNCKGRKLITKIDIVPTMSGDVKLRYCSECAKEKEEYQRKQKEESEMRTKNALKEQEKDRKYRYLKREVELYELEKRAKELGIIYKEDKQ